MRITVLSCLCVRASPCSRVCACPHRRALVSVQVADALVDEANVAFLMNMRVFQELDVLAGDAAARPACAACVRTRVLG